MPSIFGNEPAPAEQEPLEDESARDRRPLIIGGAVAGVLALAGGGYLLLGSGSDDTSAAATLPTRQAGAASGVTSSPTSTSSPSATRTVAPQFSRNPFFAVVAEATDDSTDASGASPTAGAAASGAPTASTSTSVATPSATTTASSAPVTGSGVTQPTSTASATATSTATATPTPTAGASPTMRLYVLKYRGRDATGRYGRFTLNGVVAKVAVGHKLPGTNVVVKRLTATTATVQDSRNRQATITSDGHSYAKLYTYRLSGVDGSAAVSSRR